MNRPDASKTEETTGFSSAVERMTALWINLSTDWQSVIVAAVLLTLILLVDLPTFV